MQNQVDYKQEQVEISKSKLSKFENQMNSSNSENRKTNEKFKYSVSVYLTKSQKNFYH